MKDRQYILMILDGVGLNDNEEGNAFKLANTPNIDKLLATYPNSHLKTSGESVGLPDLQMGNSEVGHTTIGAGRVIYQELTLISKKIETEEFFKNKAFLEAITNVKKENSNLHIFGLLSDGGVHSHIEHIYALLELAKSKGLREVYIHAFMDGRDTFLTDGIEYIRKLENKCKEIGIGKIATIQGRYYAMDRDKRWDRVEKAYNLMVLGEGKYAKTAEHALENSYESEIFDEFIEPIAIIDEDGNAIKPIEDRDSIIFVNFRADRVREISHAILDDIFNEFVRKKKLNKLKFVTMTEYDETLTKAIVAYKKEEIKNTLGEVLSKRGYSQLRIAETEKYAHVTFFLNGGEEKKYYKESRILIPSPKVATYDLKPEMSALEITSELIKTINEKKTDIIIVNYANGDMVGHTGNLEAAIKAVETLDVCIGKVIEKLEEVSGEAIIIADHGNCEQMVDLNTGMPLTSHTLFDVPFLIISDRLASINSGTLSDVAPTLLNLMGLDKPKEMTGKALITFKK